MFVQHLCMAAYSQIVGLFCWDLSGRGVILFCTTNEQIQLRKQINKYTNKHVTNNLKIRFDNCAQKCSSSRALRQGYESSQNLSIKYTTIMSICFLSFGFLEGQLRTIEDPSLRGKCFPLSEEATQGEVQMLVAGGRQLRGNVDRLSGDSVNDCNKICCLVSVLHGAGLLLTLKYLCK